MIISKILKNEYRDSLFLMKLSNDVSTWEGVTQAVIVMGTDSNKRILDQLGLTNNEIRQATPNDLVIAADIEQPLSEQSLTEHIDRQMKHIGQPQGAEKSYDSLESALDSQPNAGLVSLSIPGEYATGIARQTIEQGKHVFCFSHHMTVEDEIELKKSAIDKNILMLGPDCGTAILDGIGFGFANQVRRGSVGVVAASGSGLQEVVTLIHKSGGGISQAIGVGGRDMSAPVGGLMAEAAVRLLGIGPHIKLIIIIAKKASLHAQKKVLEAARETGLPIIVDFQPITNEIDPQEKWLTAAHTFEECARRAIEILGLPWHLPIMMDDPTTWLEDAAYNLTPGQTGVRGLYTGGSLCGEAASILSQYGYNLRSNLEQPIDPEPEDSYILDLGAEEYTQGRPHPFIDPRLRNLEIEQACANPDIGVILMDIVLGWGCHPDPAGEIAATLQKVKPGKRYQPAIFASVCGTEEDPQNYTKQCETLKANGVYVAGSNASAAELAAGFMTVRGRMI
jgi:FdrA protein